MKGKIEYKRPRKINVVSVTMTLVGLTLGYLGYQYFPMVLTKQEAYRVLEETSNAFALKSDKFVREPTALQSLKNKMAANLRLAGVQDPAMETWIEPGEAGSFNFGVVYSSWFEWPFGVFERREYQTEIVHELTP